jgi:hypothetical protein
MELCKLPKDIIRIIISYSPCAQWFVLSKEISTLASQTISPLNYKVHDGGSLFWALAHQKNLAFVSLLKDPRVDPSIDDNNVIRFACEFGHKEQVMLLLKDTRVDPSAKENQAMLRATANNHKDIVEILLQGINNIAISFLDPYIGDLSHNFALSLLQYMAISIILISSRSSCRSLC